MSQSGVSLSANILVSRNMNKTADTQYYTNIYHNILGHVMTL